jgi:hypothetical protein
LKEASASNPRAPLDLGANVCPEFRRLCANFCYESGTAVDD